ncbi:MAG TPA: YdeI/OmpD-associated family protein, partial [Sediminibacterium sp.]|nr:YdeI/OmpD-associated family protein [Sediminibacterium sp.]
LRSIILECALEEDYKWMHPCYSTNGNNVVLIHSFKEYTAILFFKGVLMTDKKGLLIQQTKNVQDRRQLRFTSLAEIQGLKSTIKAYVKEAIEIEKSGKKVVFKKTEEFEMPEEFKTVLQKNKAAKTAFDKLTPGRQRAYLLFFSSAKQSATRITRIESFLPKILAGKGKDD